MDETDRNENEIEESLSSLKSSGKEAEDAVVAALNRLKLAQQKLRIELEELSKTEVRSKPPLRHWLKSRQLPIHSTFEEFFQTFLEEHKAEHRLDLSTRSILLNKEGCKLFGLEGENKRITVNELLERLPLLFH
jgi:hypothetical protein